MTIPPSVRPLRRRRRRSMLTKLYRPRFHGVGVDIDGAHGNLSRPTHSNSPLCGARATQVRLLSHTGGRGGRACAVVRNGRSLRSPGIWARTRDHQQLPDVRRTWTDCSPASADHPAAVLADTMASSAADQGRRTPTPKSGGQARPTRSITLNRPLFSGGLVLPAAAAARVCSDGDRPVRTRLAGRG
jgi:hypothetical protein